mmetsp:Transcript_36382/g.88537  ORF Transcript_36382/g.88537 Transcript_36382/m.88537 type:complete len:201 (-) Transcript_36382:2303-2905(-)
MPGGHLLRRGGTLLGRPVPPMPPRVGLLRWLARAAPLCGWHVQLSASTAQVPAVRRGHLLEERDDVCGLRGGQLLAQRAVVLAVPRERVLPSRHEHRGDLSLCSQHHRGRRQGARGLHVQVGLLPQEPLVRRVQQDVAGDRLPRRRRAAGGAAAAVRLLAGARAVRGRAPLLHARRVHGLRLQQVQRDVGVRRRAHGAVL